MSMVDAVVYPYIARRKIQKLQKWRILVVSLSFRLAGVKNSNQASGLSTLFESNDWIGPGRHGTSRSLDGVLEKCRSPAE